MRERERQDRESISTKRRPHIATTVQNSVRESPQSAAYTLDQLPGSTMTRQLRQAAVLRMQETQGNAAVRRMVAVPNYENQPLPVTSTPSATDTPSSQALAAWQGSQTLSASGDIPGALSNQPGNDQPAGQTPASGTPTSPFDQVLAAWQGSQTMSVDGDMSSTLADQLKNDHSTGQSSATGSPGTTPSEQAVASWQQSQTLPTSGDVSSIDWDQMHY